MADRQMEKTLRDTVVPLLVVASTVPSVVPQPLFLFLFLLFFFCWSAGNRSEASSSGQTDGVLCDVVASLGRATPFVLGFPSPQRPFFGVWVSFSQQDRVVASCEL